MCQKEKEKRPQLQAKTKDGEQQREQSATRPIKVERKERETEIFDPAFD